MSEKDISLQLEDLQNMYDDLRSYVEFHLMITADHSSNTALIMSDMLMEIGHDFLGMSWAEMEKIQKEGIRYHEHDVN